ncbi:MAG: glycine-rich domain-containing protein [Rhodomicrobiaceae bacterium]
MTQNVKHLGKATASVLAFKKKPHLLERILAHEFDQPDAEMPFSERLGRENGWTPEFTDAVIEEYRRFVYLMCITGQELTPSDEVDQAWHLHLVHSRNYWDEFCGKVLRRPLHHGPTLGGAGEDQRYKSNYERTLELYETVFNQPAPDAIWPPASVRFEWTSHMVRTNTLLFAIEPRGPDGTVNNLRTQIDRLYWITFASGIAIGVAVYKLGLTADQAWPFIIIPVLAVMAGFALQNGIGESKQALITPDTWLRRRSRKTIQQPHHGYDVSYMLTGADKVSAIRISKAKFVKSRAGRKGGWSPAFGGTGCGGHGGYSLGGGGCGGGGGGGCGFHKNDPGPALRNQW